MIFSATLQRVIDEQRFPLVFATVSGAHLYGFPSPDSDYDLRGVHVLPLNDVIGLFPIEETIEVSGVRGGEELDLVTHDVQKFITLMLRVNGYVLEQLYSPLVLRTSEWHAELKEIGYGCITRRHSHHYLGFAQSQWRLFQKESPHRVKPLLYVFRVLLTGIHLMRTGQIEANLLHLNEAFHLSYLPELIERKLAGPEKSVLQGADIEFFGQEYTRLLGCLEQEGRESSLPDASTAKTALNDLLIRLRLVHSLKE